MRSTKITGRGIGLIAAVVAVAAACTLPKSHPADGGGTGPMRGRDAGRPDAGPPIDPPDLDGGPPIILEDVVSVEIVPADPVLDCVDAAPEVAFQAIGTLSDGTTRALNGLWRLGTSRLGQIHTDGRFEGTEGCVASGQTSVWVDLRTLDGEMLSASTTVTVRVSREPVYVDVDPASDPATLFAGTPVSGGPALLYPLDGAVMPNNVPAPAIQWETVGDVGDLYRITIGNATLSLTAYIARSADFGYAFTPDAALWRFASENYSSEPLTIGLAHRSAEGVVTESDPVTIRLLRSSVAGHVYYWDVVDDQGNGQIARIDAYHGTSETVMPSPERRCIGCHSVSPDGRYMAVMLGGGAPGDRAGVYDLATDLHASPPTPMFPPQWSDPQGVRYATSTWRYDSQRMFFTDARPRMTNPLTGQSISPTGMPPGNFYAPSWAPDNSAIMMTQMLSGITWFHTCTSGDLVRLPVTGDDAFGEPFTIHEGARLESSPEGGSVDNHPSWTPDSQLVIFEHGEHCSSDGGGGQLARMLHGALYAIRPMGARLVRLDNASSSPDHQDWWPTVAPFISVEDSTEFTAPRYYWVAFTSGRPYGNEVTGTAAAPHRQLWVTAVRADAPAGEDPSSVPYWLPGQDPEGHNMAAQWVPVACATTGETCGASSECCTGNCAQNADGAFACAPPPPAECRPKGVSCDTSSDCCSPLQCVGHVCVDELI